MLHVFPAGVCVGGGGAGSGYVYLKFEKVDIPMIVLGWTHRAIFFISGLLNSNKSSLHYFITVRV